MKTTISVLHLIRSWIWCSHCELASRFLMYTKNPIYRDEQENDSRWPRNQIIFKIESRAMIKGWKWQWIWRILIPVCHCDRKCWRVSICHLWQSTKRVSNYNKYHRRAAFFSCFSHHQSTAKMCQICECPTVDMHSSFFERRTNCVRFCCACKSDWW